MNQPASVRRASIPPRGEEATVSATPIWPHLPEAAPYVPYVPSGEMSFLGDLRLWRWRPGQPSSTDAVSTVGATGRTRCAHSRAHLQIRQYARQNSFISLRNSRRTIEHQSAPWRVEGPRCASLSVERLSNRSANRP